MTGSSMAFSLLLYGIYTALHNRIMEGMAHSGPCSSMKNYPDLIVLPLSPRGGLVSFNSRSFTRFLYFYPSSEDNTTLHATETSKRKLPLGGISVTSYLHVYVSLLSVNAFFRSALNQVCAYARKSPRMSCYYRNHNVLERAHQCPPVFRVTAESLKRNSAWLNDETYRSSISNPSNVQKRRRGS